MSVCEDEGDIIGIRASAEPGNEWRFKYQDAKFTKGIGEREGEGPRGGDVGGSSGEKDGGGVGRERKGGWEKGRLRREGGRGRR